MENNENKIEVKNKDFNPTISINNDAFFSVSLYTESFLEEKDMIKFIKKTERLVRSSPEYAQLMNYIREELNLSFCTYLNNVDKNMAAIEMHHHIYTLYDIVQIVIAKHEKENTPFNSLSIANEVLFLHYNNLCGLVPLSTTIHQLVHSDNNFYIHKDLVLGDVDSFFNMFKEYMTDELKAKYNDWVKYSETHTEDKFNTLELFDKENREAQVNRVNSVNKITINANNKEMSSTQVIDVVKEETDDLIEGIE